MRTIVVCLLLVWAAPAAPAQAVDYAGLRVFDSINASAGAPTPLSCGAAFSCAPQAFTVAPGASLSVIVTGELGGVFALAASVDVANLGCLNLGIPGLVGSLALAPSSLVSLVVGVTSSGDNGRCNGGLLLLPALVTIPPGLPSGSVVFQAVASTPLSSGGSGLAFTSPVQANF